MRKVYLVSLVALTAACAANPRPSVSNSVKPAKERTVIHLLSRTTFGPRAADVDRLYLDTWLSAAAQKGPAPGRGLNENYGRELVELHTLGVDGGYTQRDVVNSPAASPAGPWRTRTTGWDSCSSRRCTIAAKSTSWDTP